MPIIIVGVVISIVLLYGVTLFFKGKQTTAIDKLDEQKIAIFDIPVDSVILKLKNMHLSGKTKKLYESWALQWDDLNREVLPAVEADLDLAEKYSNQLKLLKSKKIIDNTRKKLSDAEKKAFQIDETLQRIVESEKSNHEEIESVRNQYESVKDKILSQEDVYRQSSLALRKKLDEISNHFGEFETLMEEADFLEAKEVLEQSKSESVYLDKISNEIPALHEEIDGVLIEQLDDLKDGYKRLKESHYKFKDDNLADKLNELEEKILSSKNLLNDLQVERAKDLKKTSEENIEKLYNLMEAEVEAKAAVDRLLPKLNVKVSQILENNKFVGIEIERLSENYELTDNEDVKISDFINQLTNIQAKIKTISEQIENNEIVFSDAKATLGDIDAKLKEIDVNQTEIKNSLVGLKNRENVVKDQLDLFELDLRNMKRKLEKQHLPGLSPSYLDLFISATKRVEELSVLINRVKINMKEVDELVSLCESDLEKLEDATNRIIDNSAITEQLVQYANRYRSAYASVEKAITTAINLYQYQYKYTEARQTIERALDSVEYGASKRVEEMYQLEKSRRI